MSAAPVLTKGKKFSLQVETGHLKGEVFHFAKPVVQIGRDTGNDIVLDKDLKVSRFHLEIRQNDNQIIINNISEKNFVLVNGQSIKSIVLNRDSVIQIGDTMFSLQAKFDNVLAPLSMLTTQMSQQSQQSPPHQPPPSYTSLSVPAKKSRSTLYIIIAILVAAGFWLNSGGGNKKKLSNELRTTVEAEQDVGLTQDKIAQLEKKLEQDGRGTIQYEMAQQHYIKGFRDYRQGQYGRALQSFSASIALYPQHELARRHLALAQKKLDELIKMEMNLGKKYLEQGNYRLCNAAYKKVLSLIGDSKDINYREAHQYMRQCDLQQKERY